MSIYESVVSRAYAAGMTIDAVERAAGLSNGTIGKWRVYIPRADRLLKVARVLNVDINELLEGVGYDEKQR